MAEYDFYEYYKSKTPLELNRELGALIESLPEAPPGISFDEIIAIAQSRKGSRDRQIFEARRKALLPLAIITTSYAEFIADALTTSFGLGVEKPASIAWIVDQDGPGIFDPSTAREFDRRGYKIESTNASKFYAALGNLAEEIAQPVENFSEVLNSPVILDRTQHVRKWRQEFINKYSEEP